jgi:arginine-tRNA-protein transferase
VRTFRSEGPLDYGQYAFGYTLWLELEASEPPGAAYAGGYLPYSGNPEAATPLFYMARSLRVDLKAFRLAKGRRYDHRQWLRHGLRRRLVSRQAFLDTYGSVAPGLALGWMQTRFGEPFLTPARLGYILQHPCLRNVLTWEDSSGLRAFALLARWEAGVHYWFVFYANGDPEAHPPGHGYLVDFLQWAREEGLPHAYLGTTYGLKSRYKSRGIEGIEYWDGNRWMADRKQLHRLQASDD